MLYLIFAGELYEATGGMGDLRWVIRTDEELLDWARANLPSPAYRWADVVGVTESAVYEISEEGLLEGKIRRGAPLCSFSWEAPLRAINGS